MVDESPLAVAQEMANVLFNLSQAEGQKLTADERRQLRALYARWNIASVPRVGARPTPEIALSEDRGAVPVALPAPSREEVWLRTFITLAGLPGVDGAKSREWADRALAAFDERFPPK